MTTNSASFQSIRAMLDVRVPACAMVVVTSAREDDGQDELAYGIAQAFVEAGKRTALLSLYDGIPISRPAADVRDAYEGATFHAPPSANDLNSTISDVRSNHDVVIVASPPIGTKSSSLDACRLANGVVLAVRLGRKITAQDQQAVEQLHNLKATLLGTVAMRAVARETQQPDVLYGRALNIHSSADPHVGRSPIEPILRALRARSNGDTMMWLVSAGILAALLRPM